MSGTGCRTWPRHGRGTSGERRRDTRGYQEGWWWSYARTATAAAPVLGAAEVIKEELLFDKHTEDEEARQSEQAEGSATLPVYIVGGRVPEGASVMATPLADPGPADRNVKGLDVTRPRTSAGRRRALIGRGTARVAGSY